MSNSFNTNMLDKLDTYIARNKIQSKIALYNECLRWIETRPPSTAFAIYKAAAPLRIKQLTEELKLC